MLLLLLVAAQCGGYLVSEDRLPAFDLMLFPWTSADSGDPAALNSSSVVVTDVVTGGNTYQVVSYASDGAPRLSILSGGQVVADNDLAYSILLTYAWRPEFSRAQSTDTAGFRTLAADLRSIDGTYKPLFATAHALEPVLEAVDRLRDYPINGIPSLEIGSIPLISIQNAWDLLCTIPVDAADLCLLEEPLRAYHDEAVDIEQRMAAAADDLEKLADVLDLTLAEPPTDGSAIKTQAQDTAQSLENLARRLDSYASRAHDLDQKVLVAVDVLANRRWGANVQRSLDQLQQLLPGFDEKLLLDAVVTQLRSVDGVLSKGEQSAQQSAGDLRAQQAIVDAVLMNVDTQVQASGRSWTTELPPGE